MAEHSCAPDRAYEGGVESDGRDCSRRVIANLAVPVDDRIITGFGIAVNAHPIRPRAAAKST
jgi:hypothetical protein